MNIEKVIQEDRQAKLTVEYSPEEFEKFKRRAAKKISKNAKIPGFRPGKAPYQVIVNHYGEGAIVQEAIDLLIDDDYSKILEETEIEPSGSGNLESIDNLDPPKFILIVPLKPEIDLGDYRSVRIDYQPEPFDESEVDAFILNLQRNSATIIPAERPAEEDDLVYFNLSGEFLNPETDEDATITDKTPQQVVIPAEDKITSREWPFPGFSRALLGVKAGDVKEIQHAFPDDHYDEEFQGKTAIFTVEVQSVKALELPDVDEDFVESLGNYESPEQFREKLEERLRVEHEEAYEHEYFNAILNEIIENTAMNYPPQMLEHEEEHTLEDLKSRLEKQNMDFETYLKLRDTDEETFMINEVRPNAKQRLERNLVVDTLVDAEGLVLDESLFKEQINHLMSEVFRSGKVTELQKQMGDDGFSRMISMEGVSRTINTQLKNRLKLIATGQPIPEEDDSASEEQESSEGSESTMAAEEIHAIQETADEDEKFSADEDSIKNEQELNTVSDPLEAANETENSLPIAEDTLEASAQVNMDVTGEAAENAEFDSEIE